MDMSKGWYYEPSTQYFIGGESDPSVYLACRLLAEIHNIFRIYPHEIQGSLSSLAQIHSAWGDVE